MTIARLLWAAGFVLQVRAQLARTTVDGCECLRDWDLDSFTCGSYCCNPGEQDSEGDWCYTVPGSGEALGTCPTDSTWGTCVPLVEDLEFPGYSVRHNNLNISQFANDDSTSTDLTSALARCDSTPGCTGVTCIPLVDDPRVLSCTIRAGLGIGYSSSGEFSYFKTPDGCTDNRGFLDEIGADCSTWVDYNCSEVHTDMGFTEAGMAAVRIFCPRACGECYAETVNCPVLTSPEAGTILIPNVTDAQCCEVLGAFLFSTLAQTDVLPMPWYGIVIMLDITECVVPNEWGECVEEGSDYEHTASSLAFGNLVRWLCDNPQCNTSNLETGGIVSLYTGQLVMPAFHEILSNDYLMTNCQTAPLPSRSGSNSALEHAPIYPGPPPLPDSTVVQHGIRSRDGSTDVIDREVDVYFRVPTMRTTTESPPPSKDSAHCRCPWFAFGLAVIFGASLRQ